MSFECTLNDLDQARVVSLQGRLDSATAGQLEKQLQSLFEAPVRHVLFDMSALDYISSAGLRIGLMTAKRAKQAQVRLVLCSMLPHVKEVFEISGFLKIIECTDTREDALTRLA